MKYLILGLCFASVLFGQTYVARHSDTTLMMDSVQLNGTAACTSKAVRLSNFANYGVVYWARSIHADSTKVCLYVIEGIDSLKTRMGRPKKDQLTLKAIDSLWTRATWYPSTCPLVPSRYARFVVQGLTDNSTNTRLKVHLFKGF